MTGEGLSDGLKIIWRRQSVDETQMENQTFVRLRGGTCVAVACISWYRQAETLIDRGTCYGADSNYGRGCDDVCSFVRSEGKSQFLFASREERLSLSSFSRTTSNSSPKITYLSLPTHYYLFLLLTVDSEGITPFSISHLSLFTVHRSFIQTHHVWRRRSRSSNWSHET